ncbi:hypothetical protein AYX19_13780 [Paenarthrobacter ureafaciens]|nr:hypothetical protein AYX19_13780 [Paenarthrobacter ureafaciens]
MAPFGGKFGEPVIVRLRESSRTEFVPFQDHDVEIRRVICTTNAIESINARYRRAVRALGHFTNEKAALKCLYLVTRSLGNENAQAHTPVIGQSQAGPQLIPGT